MKNYYEILEVSENASDEIIDRAYRVLAKKYHPDTCPSSKSYWAENKFKEITEAYQILSNPALRKKYDMELVRNNSLNDKYNDLYSEQKRLTQEVNNLKFKSKTHTYSNQVDNIDKSPKSIFLHLKSFFISVKKLIQNEKNKSAEERSKDLTALILTIIIVVIILFIFWRVPFLKKFLFP